MLKPAHSSLDVLAIRECMVYINFHIVIKMHVIVIYAGYNTILGAVWDLFLYTQV